MSNVKNILHYILVTLAVAAMMPACTRDRGIDYFEEVPQGVTLRLSTGAVSMRGDEHYDDDEYAEQKGREEEVIDRIDLFFFSSAVKEIEDYSNEDEDDEDGRYVDNDTEQSFFAYELKNVKAVTTYDMKVKIPVELLNNFASDGSAYVYALVNLPSDIKVDAAQNLIDGKPATLGNIKSLWVSEQGFIRSGVPSAFVMRGGETVQFDGGNVDHNTSVSGVVRLERLASKMRLWADIPEKIYIGEDGKTIRRNEGEDEAAWTERAESAATEIWESRWEGQTGGPDVKLYLYNIATNGRIDAFSERGEEYDALYGYGSVARGDEFDNIARKLTTSAVLNEVDYDTAFPFSHTTAYYSYPNRWDSTTPSEEHQTYFIITMPWRRYDKETSSYLYQNCYYQVPVNALKSDKGDADNLRPNMYYRVKIYLGVLGSKDLGSPTPVDASYEVVEWVTNDINVNIKERRYLLVQNQWTMNNVSDLEIPFSSSHNVELIGCYVNYFRYNDRWGTDDNSEDTHNSLEHKNWLNARGNDNLDVDGEIWSVVDGVNTMLYYKKEYFYDEIYDKDLKKDNGYYYYVGKEHPKTIQNDCYKYDESVIPADSIPLWDKYNLKYGQINGVYLCEVDNKNKVIHFSHPLIQWRLWTNSNGKRYYMPVMNPHSKDSRFWEEYSRCEIIIKIRHADWEFDEDELFEETINITQYPGIYIEVSHDYGTPGTKSNNGTDYNQYVIVNGNYNEGSNNEWDEVNGDQVASFAGVNNNPNMYVIHTTQLSDEDEILYDIGDPRTLNWNNLLTDKSMEETGPVQNNEKTGNGNNYKWSGYKLARTWGGSYTTEYYSTTIANGTRVYETGSNSLKYYYPADETTYTYIDEEGKEHVVGYKENFIAPSFRIASSFGKVSSGYKQEARRRCAVYQEAGRPAGRWRLPTYAEVHYIAQLSADGKIPVLFGNSDKPKDFGYYWSANYPLMVNASGDVIIVTDSTMPEYGLSPRCVYDEWYWNKIDEEIGEYTIKPLTRTYYMGDMPKDNTQQ